jgi:hypothetical protein
MAPHTLVCHARGLTVLSNAWWTKRQPKINDIFFVLISCTWGIFFHFSQQRCAMSRTFRENSIVKLWHYVFATCRDKQDTIFKEYPPFLGVVAGHDAVAILDLTKAITCIAWHSFERIGNHLYFILHGWPIADFNTQKYEEAKGLTKGLTPEVHDDVAIDHKREDSGSSAMGFPLFREKKRTLPGGQILRNLQAVKKGDYFF